MHDLGVALLRRLMKRIGRSSTALRKFIQIMSRLHLFVYRWTKGLVGGRLGLRHARIVLLTTIGRKTGRRRTVPLLSFDDAGDLVIVASHGGLDRHPSWWLNLQANPQAWVETDGRIVAVEARQADAESAQRLWSSFLKAFPGYADYRRRTTRDFPIVILHPVAERHDQRDHSLAASRARNPL